MSRTRNNIDFEIIWKKIHRMISSDDEQQLNEWLNEDKKHQKFYSNAAKFYSEGSQFSNEKRDTDLAWKKVQHQTSKVRKNLIRIAAVSSTVAASILIVAALFYFTNRNTEVEKLAEKPSTIVPGTDKAILHLSDGSQFVLSNSETLQLSDGNSQITSTGTKIQYATVSEEVTEIRYNTLEVPRGGKFFLELADGTKVWLNSESTICFPVQFSAGERNVELTGEAYFEVTRNEHAPFLVSSESQVVKVLGTQFNVSSYPENNLIFTTLVEGKVEVFDKANPENKCFLNPSEQSIFSKKDLLVNSRKVDPAEFTGWKSDRFIFNDERMTSITETLSRWYDVDFVFVNESRKEIRFTGNLPRNENVQEILAKIEKTEEVKFKINEKTILIE